MKKILTPVALCFLFLTPVGISVAEGSIIEDLGSFRTSLGTDRLSVLRNVLTRLDTVANTATEEELRDNNNDVTTRLRGEIPANADILLLDALRGIFHARILILLEQNLADNIQNLLKFVTEHDAVALEFYERRQNGLLH
jgi:hypothetical protein